MYRYHVDNAVTYTPDDLALFRESPFALWMERLTLENPDHGILPDLHPGDPARTEQQQNNIVETLRAEGRQVSLIDWELAESERRAATLAAMRDGADFIVNGQLAVDALSGSANLLMRTSGYSELGDFLYIPCETQTRNHFHSAFRLSFAANLLHSLQGQLPPQMLVIRDGADLVPLQTEDHIYYYLAVQKRFLHAMKTFRKHRMPDPVESSHFGRWSACASEVLKQRGLREQYQADELQAEEEAAQSVEMPPLRVASGSSSTQDSYQPGVASPSGFAGTGTGMSTMPTEALATPGHTLAEQARMLDPGSFHPGAAPGRTPNLAKFPVTKNATPEPENQTVKDKQNVADAALQNLEFIGRSSTGLMPVSELSTIGGEEASSAPPPTLRETAVPSDQTEKQKVDARPVEISQKDLIAPRFLPPDLMSALELPPELPPELPFEPLDSLPLDGEIPKFRSHAVVDLDSAPAPSLVPEPKSSAESNEPPDKPDELEDGEALPIENLSDEDYPTPQPFGFSDSLNTSQDFEDR